MRKWAIYWMLWTLKDWMQVTHVEEKALGVNITLHSKSEEWFRFCSLSFIIFEGLFWKQ